MTRIALLLLIPAVTIIAIRDRARERQVAAVSQQLDHDASVARRDLRRVRQRVLERAQAAYSSGDYREAAAIASVLEQDYDTPAELRVAAMEIVTASRKRLPGHWEF